jgi:hypothetical protein
LGGLAAGRGFGEGQVVLNQALLAATDPAGAPEPARDPARFGA